MIKMKNWWENLGKENVKNVVIKISSPKKQITVAGCQYEDERGSYIYLLTDYSTWPPVIKKSTFYKVGDDHWYVGAYIFEEDITTEFKDYHPFGANTILVLADPDFVNSETKWTNAKILPMKII